MAKPAVQAGPRQVWWEIKRNYQAGRKLVAKYFSSVANMSDLEWVAGQSFTFADSTQIDRGGMTASGTATPSSLSWVVEGNPLSNGNLLTNNVGTRALSYNFSPTLYIEGDSPFKIRVSIESLGEISCEDVTEGSAGKGTYAPTARLHSIATTRQTEGEKWLKLPGYNPSRKSPPERWTNEEPFNDKELVVDPLHSGGLSSPPRYEGLSKAQAKAQAEDPMKEWRRSEPNKMRGTPVHVFQLLDLISDAISDPKSGGASLSITDTYMAMSVEPTWGQASVHARQRVTVAIVGAQDTSDGPVTLTKATTKDARSVTVDYKVAGGAPVGDLSFKVFRSKGVKLDPSSTLLGTESAKATDLAPGAHEVTLLKGKDLPPDPDRPYVVVVATANGKTSQTYFRKWRLATVAHGFAGKLPFDQSGTMAWANLMASSLKSVDRFDDALALNWAENSVKAIPHQTQLAGTRLATQIQEYRVKKAKEHPGDVVDLHMVGHSRGTIVTSQALLELARSGQMGSRVEVTLLDPHPANPASDDLQDHRLSQLGKYVYGEYLKFQAAAVDPEIVLPANVGIHSVEVWNQQTMVDLFEDNQPRDFTMNLWGESQPTGRIANDSGVDIRWHNLTSFPSKNVFRPRPIGHDGVHVYYQDNFVAKGLVK